MYIFIDLWKNLSVGCWSAAVVWISLPARLKLCWDSPSLHGGASWFLALQLRHMLSIWLIFSSLHQIMSLLHVFLYWLKSWSLYTFCRQQNVILVNFWITASHPWKIQFYCYNTFYFILFYFTLNHVTHCSGSCITFFCSLWTLQILTPAHR